MVKAQTSVPDNLPKGRHSLRVGPTFSSSGAPKCGTTAMAHYLASHPDIFMARKEMNVFGADLHFAPQFYRRDIPAYLAEFERARWQAQGGRSLRLVSLLSTRGPPRKSKLSTPRLASSSVLREPVGDDALALLPISFRRERAPSPALRKRPLAAEGDRAAPGGVIGRQTYFVQGLHEYREAARAH